MEEPERFENLPRGVQIQLAAGGALLLGIIAGLVAVHGSAAYWIIQAIAALGGLAAGTEHDGPRDGAIRGVIGGLLFGLALWVAYELTNEEAVVDPHPTLALPIVTTLLGALLGALGGILGARARRRHAGAPRA